MSVLCLLVSTLVQEPKLVGPLAALDVDVEVHAVARQLQLGGDRATGPLARLFEVVAKTPTDAIASAEVEIRAAVEQLEPAALVRASGRLFRGVGKDAKVAPRLDLRGFEDAVEKVYRQVLQAIGPGRDPSLFAPELQATLERALRAQTIATADHTVLDAALLRAGKFDYPLLQAQAVALVQLATALLDNREVLARLPVHPGKDGVSGTVLIDRGTPFGRFVVGGPGHNEYACEQLAVIVDLGGDDVYRGPAAGAGLSRRLALVADAGGNDRYEAANDGVGSATLGVGVLLDLAGDDTYLGGSRCAGFGLLGVGACLDLDGKDTYQFDHDAVGAGCLGLGLCVDLGAGQDTMQVAGRGIAVGLPGGLGMLVDDGGDDLRRVARGDTTSSAGVGFGFGLPDVIVGGCGLFVDLDGADTYVGADHLCGAAWRAGGGLFFEAGGDDRYELGAACLGAAEHGGFGLAVDATGKERYRLGALCLGAAFGGALGMFEDRAGDDEYDLAGDGGGHADGGALAVFRDLAGVDRYTLSATTPARRDSALAKARALAVFCDFGASKDQYVGAGRVLGNDLRDRRESTGVNGVIVRVFVDR